MSKVHVRYLTANITHLHETYNLTEVLAQTGVLAREVLLHFIWLKRVKILCETWSIDF